MIYIKEVPSDGDSIVIRVDGYLDRQSISILEDVCRSHLQDNKKVLLHLEGLVHITREGRDFVEKIREKVTLVNPPQFMRLQGPS